MSLLKPSLAAMPDLVTSGALAVFGYSAFQRRIFWKALVSFFKDTGAMKCRRVLRNSVIAQFDPSKERAAG